MMMRLTMMLALAAVAGAAFAQTPGLAQTKVAGVSMFKNGYAVVLRETTIPAGDKAFYIPNVPPAALGTFWIQGSTGVKLLEAVSTTFTEKGERPAMSMDEILFANLNREVVLFIYKSDGKEQAYRGKLLSVAGDWVVLQGDDGQTHLLSKSTIREIQAANGEFNYKLPTEETKRVIRIRATGPAGAKLYTISMEKGVSWAPGYAVELKDDMTLKLTGKATIINETLDLDNVEARLITGFPNIRFIGSEDPFTSTQNLFQFVNGLGGGGGGMGPGGGAMSQNVGRAREAEASDRDESFSIMDPSALEGFQAEDLFFYRQPNVTLKPSERGYYMMFEGEGKYEQYFTTDLNAWTDMNRTPGVPVEGSDVWNTIEFLNPIKQPLTTAAATVMKSGEMLGQDMMTYTSPGGKATLKITKALDIKVKSESEMVDRRPSQIKDKDGRVIYDIITVKGKIEAISLRPKPVDLRITYSLDGDIKSTSPNGDVTKSTINLAQTNPRSVIKWKAELQPGKRQEFTFSYEMLVPAI
jgi:hypothetical protein